MDRRWFILQTLLLAAVVSGRATPARAQGVPNPVIEWNVLVQPAIHSATAPRSAGTSEILHTMASLAVYDAVMAIEGGYRPYAARLPRTPYADVRAAVATAAYLTVRPRIVPAQLGYLDQTYATYMAAVPDGDAKAEGARVGQQAAEALLARRADDGYGATVPYACSSVPPPVGEFVPDTGCPTGPTSPQPVDAKVGGIRPFTLKTAAVLWGAGPAPFGSRTYRRDFAETRDIGRLDSTLRSPDQTDVAYFWSENPYVHWNRNLVALARSRGLDTRDAARFFALVHTTVSDALIAGFGAKYHYRAWRPKTAIPLADFDDNPFTEADPTWRPLLNVNHPEFPSGHGFWSTALAGAVAAHFRSLDLDWTITTSKTAVPQLQVAERTYATVGDLLHEIENARVWAGLHWRHSIRRGSAIGARVALHVARHHFRPVRDQER